MWQVTVCFAILNGSISNLRSRPVKAAPELWRPSCGARAAAPELCTDGFSLLQDNGLAYK